MYLMRSNTIERKSCLMKFVALVTVVVFALLHKVVREGHRPWDI